MPHSRWRPDRAGGGKGDALPSSGAAAKGPFAAGGAVRRAAAAGGCWGSALRAPSGELGGVYGRNQPRSAPKSGLGGSSGLLKCPGAPRGFAEPPAGRARLWGGLWEGELGPCCCGNRVEGRTWRT